MALYQLCDPGPSGSQSGKGTVRPRKDGPSRKLSKTSKMLFSLCKTLTLRMQRPASPRVAPSDRGRRASHPQRTRKVLWKTSEGLDVAPGETRPGGRSVLTLPRAHPCPPCRTSCSPPLLGPCRLRAPWTLATDWYSQEVTISRRLSSWSDSLTPRDPLGRSKQMACPPQPPRKPSRGGGLHAQTRGRQGRP